MRLLTITQTTYITVNWPTLIIWWKVYLCTNFERNLSGGAIYLPPRSSYYNDIELFIRPEADILHLGIDDNMFVLCGDFNAHVGIKSDVLEIDETVNKAPGIIPETNEVHNTKNLLQNLDVDISRPNQDKLRIDDYGRRLMEICHHISICLLNGRAGEDKNVSKVTTKLNTVVDYLIASPLIFQKLENFVVEDFDPSFSDVHCALK